MLIPAARRRLADTAQCATLTLRLGDHSKQWGSLAATDA